MNNYHTARSGECWADLATNPWMCMSSKRRNCCRLCSWMLGASNTWQSERYKILTVRNAPWKLLLCYQTI